MRGPRTRPLVLPLLVAALGALAAGCSPTPSSDTPPQPTSTPTTTSKPKIRETPGEEPPPPPKGGAGALDTEQRAQMEIALRRGGEGSAQCPQVVEGMPGGEGDVRVTFDGTTGRVKEVVVPAPWAGTPGETCIRTAFQKEVVLRFDGDPIEVPYTIKLVAKASAAPPPKKPK